MAKKDTVRNLRNSISENQQLFEILGNILKLYLAIIFGVRIFRVFEVLGKLPYLFFPFFMGACCITIFYFMSGGSIRKFYFMGAGDEKRVFPPYI